MYKLHSTGSVKLALPSASVHFARPYSCASLSKSMRHTYVNTVGLCFVRAHPKHDFTETFPLSLLGKFKPTPYKWKPTGLTLSVPVP